MAFARLSRPAHLLDQGRANDPTAEHGNNGDANLDRRSVLRGLALAMFAPSLFTGCGTRPMLPSGRLVEPGMLVAEGDVVGTAFNATSFFRDLVPSTDADYLSGVVCTWDAHTEQPLDLPQTSRNAALRRGDRIQYRVPECDEIVLALLEADRGWTIGEARTVYGNNLLVVRDGIVLTDDLLPRHGGLSSRLRSTDWLCMSPGRPSRA